MISHESFLLPPPQSCKWRRTWIPNNYTWLMLFESIPHIKDSYSGFKLEQISFPRDSGCCIASFWENKTNNKKKKTTSRHCQPQRSRKAEEDFRVPFPWNSMSEAGEARQFPSVLCTLSTRGWENCRSREPMELYRLAPWKIDGFLFRVQSSDCLPPRWARQLLPASRG